MTLYGVLAEFTEPSQIIQAAEHIQDHGFKNWDAYTPFPIEELQEIKNIHHHDLTRITLVVGITVALAAFFLQYIQTTSTYPLNIGGRPLNSWPLYIPITFELTVLLSAFAIGLSMILLNKMPRLYHPLQNIEAFNRSTQDRFFLCILSTDPLFKIDQIHTQLIDLGATKTYEVPQ